MGADLSLRARRKDGSTFPAGISLGPIVTAEGRFVASAVGDITAQVQADTALRESEDLFRQMFEGSEHGIVIASLDGYLIRVNRAFCDFLGRDEADLVGKHFVAITHPDDTDASSTVSQQIQRGEAPTFSYQKRYMHAEGHAVWAHLSGSTVMDAQGSPSCVIGHAVDITAQMTAQEALVESEQLFREAFLTAGHGMALVGLDGRLLKVNQAICEMLGYDETELLSRDFASITYPDDLDKDVSEFGKLLGGEIRTYSMEKRYIHAEGHVIWGHLAVALIRDGDDEPLYAVGQVHDITGRKQADEALRRSEVIVSNSSDMLALLDTDYRYLAANRAYLKAFGKTAEQVLGRTLAEVVGKEMFEVIRPHADRCLGGEDVRFERWLEFPAGKAYADVSCQPYFDAGNEVSGVVVRVQDITDRIEADEQRKLLEGHLAKMERMDTIGTLAAGIAHDFNNLLVPIIGYTGMVRDALGSGDPLREKLARVLEAGERATDLVARIQMFSRDVEPDKEALRLADVVEEAFSFLRASVPATVEMTLRVDRASPTIYADPVQIHQVVMNLGVNAAHAVHEAGGAIEVTVDETELDRQFVGLHPHFSGGKAARLRVRDSGVGMSPETVERIFEPFYSTKGPDEGTGLGLSVLYGVVQSHGGVVTVDSGLGKGTTFELLFPIEEAEPDAQGESARESKGGIERILVVDDEALIGDLLQLTLEDIGYSVDVHSGAEAALAGFRADVERYDLVITDQMMPGLTGSAMAAEMLSARPDLPIILMSGHKGVKEPVSAVDVEVACVLKKPFTREQLAATIREVLDSRPRTTIRGESADAH